MSRTVNHHTATVDALAATLGYSHIGGMAVNRVYLHRGRGEILKVAVTADPAQLEYKRADLARCLEVSTLYAAQGLMPEVLEVGQDFCGTGLPFLRERYVHGQNLGRAYLSGPRGWVDRLPRELTRIYRSIAAGPRYDVRGMWAEKLRWLACPKGYDDLTAAVRRAGEYCRDHCTTGYRIHGDLQFGNILAAEHEDGSLGIVLIDWEMSEIMPLGYEFAMLYFFLLDPVPQVEDELKAAYARLRPLGIAWQAIAAVLAGDLGVSRTEFEQSVIFRMGIGALDRLAQAVERGDAAEAERPRRHLAALTRGEYFERLPYPTK